MYSTSMLWRRLPSPSITPNELLEILTAHNAGYYVLPTEPNDEVYPGIFVGDSTTALCVHLLRRLGITHVLNAACGKQRNFGMVNTSAGYYRNSGIEFLGIEALDIAVFPLFEHFYTAVDFIDRALSQNGKVLVHCGEGISRSSTLVLAYLMIKRGFRVQDAVRQVVKHRNILPNQGFLLQLCQLHDQLQLNASLPASPTPSPSTMRSSVSPYRECVSSSVRSTGTASRSSDKSSRTVSSSGSCTPDSRYSSPQFGNRCSSPLPTSWSNGWTPPASIRSNSSCVRTITPNTYITLHTSKYPTSSKSYALSSSSPSRSYRCQSVDREFLSTRSSYTGALNGNRNGFSSSLMSSYLRKPQYSIR